MATVLQVQEKAGANVSSVSSATAYINSYIVQAEALVNFMVEYNFGDVYASLNVDVKGVLTHAVSCKAAQMVIVYDTDGIVPTAQAELRMDFLDNEFNKIIKDLRDRDKQSFVIDA